MSLSNLKMKKQNISDIDIISNLPDSVLSHILSFVPTKEVVATSILSKQWRNVWTLVDKLVFESRDITLKKHYRRLVYRVLKLHQGNIKDLRLCWYGDLCKEIDVISWINTAISRGVEKLDVTTDLFFRCPLSLFSCETLVDLKIPMLDIASIKVPITPIFPRLKKLHISILNCDAESFKHIVSQCSILEHLIVFAHKFPLDIASSSMKRLEIHSRLSTALGVPSLEYLLIDCISPPMFTIEEKLFSLVEADVKFPYSVYSRYMKAKPFRDTFVRFIQLLSNVKVLRLECHFAKFLNSVGHGQFLNLTKLEIVSRFFEWRLLVSLMESSINLEVVTLKKTFTFKAYKLPWKNPKCVPTCLSSSLKTLSIDGYSDDELPMVKYVLRNAQILERIDIRCASCNMEDDKWKSGIQMLYRACERCEIRFV